MDVESIEKYLKFLTKDKIQFHVSRMAAEDSIDICLVSRVKVSSYDLAKDGSKAIFSKVEVLRDNLLQSDLFYNERKQLEEYDRLNNMYFVLEALKELDLSSIKEVKPENTYFDTMKALGGK